MRDADPDFRIVAADDLMKALTEQTLKIAEPDEADVIQAVLRLLADTNGEVQNRAVQWYVYCSLFTITIFAHRMTCLWRRHAGAHQLIQLDRFYTNTYSIHGCNLHRFQNDSSFSIWLMLTSA